MPEIRSHRRIGAASLIAAPALMSIGDLIHPPESLDATTQVAIISAAADRWYWAHLLLLAGMLFFVPSLLALTAAAADRRPTLGYASRLLLLVSVGALSAVFSFEMVLGSFVARGEHEAAVVLLDAFTARVLVALLPGLLAFFVGIGLLVASLASAGDPYRWPALCLGMGALLILGEILAAKVVLSQIGNLLILLAGIGFARMFRHVSRASGHPAV